MNKRKELIVSAIENGTVIDHIPADKVFEVIKILDLEHSKNSVYFGTNLESKKYGHKGIIKISDKYFDPEDINKIALVAPSASHIDSIVKCFNPNCVTNKENVSTKFDVLRDDNGKVNLKCHYCEKYTTGNNIEFI